MAGNRANIRHFEDPADLAILRIVNFTEIKRIRRIHPRAQLIAEPRADNHQADIFAVEFAEHVDQMIDFLAVLLFPDAAGKQHNLFEGNSEFPLDVLLRFGDRREILKIDRVVRDEYLAAAIDPE